MKRSSSNIGTDSEELAAVYLIGKGYRIIKRNFRFGRNGEIDIVALDGDTLVFIEVKARSSVSFGLPEMAVTPSKQRTLRMVARGYCYVHATIGQECRFDVIAIDLYRRPPEIRHIVNAFW